MNPFIRFFLAPVPPTGQSSSNSSTLRRFGSVWVSGFLLSYRKNHRRKFKIVTWSFFQVILVEKTKGFFFSKFFSLFSTMKRDHWELHVTPSIMNSDCVFIAHCKVNLLSSQKSGLHHIHSGLQCPRALFTFIQTSHSFTAVSPWWWSGLSLRHQLKFSPLPMISSLHLTLACCCRARGP